MRRPIHCKSLETMNSARAESVIAEEEDNGDGGVEPAGVLLHLRPALAEASRPAEHVFSTDTANAALHDGRYGVLQSYITGCIDVGRSTAAFDWCINIMRQGHIIGMYFVLRNKLKAGSAGTVLSSRERTHMLEVYAAMYIRVFEDAAACMIVLGEDCHAAANALLSKTKRWWDFLIEDPAPLPHLIDVVKLIREDVFPRIDTNAHAMDSPNPTWLMGYAKPYPWNSHHFHDVSIDRVKASRLLPHVGDVRAAVRNRMLDRMSIRDVDWKQMFEILPESITDAVQKEMGPCVAHSA